MKTFNVKFTRTNKSYHHLEVEARNEEEAIRNAKDMLEHDEAGDTYRSLIRETDHSFVAFEEGG